ncbi:uncharacterized protein LOC132270110 [Cornus florida]|uniref:uncharacterized protein LOC132270110 n=1 Tax=Cornus florida TaxID=4283 RepID=UPI00289987F0|nr:uncharacterized protein LOC132270110 [Cornus florida]
MPAGSDRSAVVCYQCQQPGHYKSSCPMKSSSVSSTPKACYGCGQQGHLIRDCPGQGAGTGSGRGSRQRPSQSATVQSVLRHRYHRDVFLHWHRPMHFLDRQFFESRQKSYADKRIRPLSFEVGDHVFLRVSPRKGLMRFGKSGKLSPRFIGPFEILDRVGEVAYRLALPPQMDRVHNVFHISMLRKYEPNPSHILSWVDVDIDEDVSYEEGPVQILDTQQKVLRNKTIPMVKVLWRHHGVEEATWELEQEVRSKYPALFSSSAVALESRGITDGLAVSSARMNSAGGKLNYGWLGRGRLAAAGEELDHNEDGLSCG